MLRTITVLSLAAAVSLPAHARVDAAQAARLGQDLMPLGGSDRASYVGQRRTKIGRASGRERV